MKPTMLAVITTVSICVVLPARAADATSPIDYKQRNAPFAPADSVTAEKQKPASNSRVQDKRVEKPTFEKKTSPLLDHQAAVEVKETNPKHVREKDSHRPERIDQPTSSYNHRTADIATATDTTKPPMVAKYQDSLTTANAVKTVKTSALDRVTTATINRFTFRKNPSESSAPINGSPVVPAAGGSVLQK
jgi:hypothetical protein